MFGIDLGMTIFFFFKQKTAYDIGLGIPAEPLFRSPRFPAPVDGMNIISNDGSNKLNRSRKARVSYKVQRTINASLNAARSEERRVGKESRSRWLAAALKKNTRIASGQSAHGYSTEY